MFLLTASLPRSAELRFGQVRKKPPVRADSEIGAPLSAMLLGVSLYLTDLRNEYNLYACRLFRKTLWPLLPYENTDASNPAFRQ
jgi:hypothetical protein